MLNGKFGLFPSNFVKEMEESDEADADSGNTELGKDALSWQQAISMLLSSHAHATFLNAGV